MSRFTVKLTDPVLSRVGKIVGTVLSALALTIVLEKLRPKKPSTIAGEETSNDPIVATFKKWFNHHD